MNLLRIYPSKTALIPTESGQTQRKMGINTFPVVLIKKTQLTTDVYNFKFSLKEPNQIDFQAGQYLILLVPQKNGEFVRRQFSLATPPQEKNEFEILFKMIEGGVASEYFKDMSGGSEVMFQGPAGKFMLRENKKNKIFLATGTGLAPIRSMIKKSQISKPKPQMNLFWGLKTVGDIYFFDELKEREKQIANFHFYYCLSREKNLDAVKEEDKKYFILGRVTQALEKLNVLRSTFYDYYLCGGREIVESLRQYLLGQGITPENIFFEKF